MPFRFEYPLWHMMLATGASFCAILLLTKLLGKEQISELTLYDYINGITIGSIAATVATDPPDQAVTHLLDLVTYTGLTFLVAWLALRSRTIRRFVEGTPTVVVYHGRILEQNLRKNKYSIDNLKAGLRSKEIFNISDVECAVLESGGSLSVLKKADSLPLTRADVNIKPPREQIPLDLITEGQVHHANLRVSGKDVDWLRDQLAMYNIVDVKDVFYAALDTKGRLYVDQRENRDEPPEMH